MFQHVPAINSKPIDKTAVEASGWQDPAIFRSEMVDVLWYCFENLGESAKSPKFSKEHN